MDKLKLASKQYKASLAVARQAGGDENQSHWEARLKAELKRPPKSTRKPAKR